MNDHRLSTNEPEMPGLPFLRLHSGSAPKLGVDAVGSVHYELLADPERNDIFLRLSGNDGSGNHSQEAVPFSRIEAVVAGLEAGKSFPSRTFRSCFRGRSQNNPGFLCCALRAEGLLAPAPDRRYQHVLSGDWSGWRDELLSREGAHIELLSSLVPDAMPTGMAGQSGSLRGRRRARQAGEQGGEDACSA